jgi:hypothetical protein
MKKIKNLPFSLFQEPRKIFLEKIPISCLQIFDNFNYFHNFIAHTVVLIEFNSKKDERL